MENWNDERKPLNFEKTRKGGLGKALETILNKTHQPSSRMDGTFRGKDMTFITNENGEPITLFLGKRKPNGDIAGEMFSRRIKKVENGLIKESHWDNQGKVS
jgi:hypothetical protein